MEVGPRPDSLAPVFAGCLERRSADGALFQVTAPESFPPEMQDAFGDLSVPVVPAAATVFKASRRKLVARLPRPGGGSVVFKVFPLGPFSWLRHAKFGLAEFHHTRTAASLGIPVPVPLAFFEKRTLGLVMSCGLVMEDLVGWTDLRALGAGIGTLEAARLAVEPLRLLARHGCLHGDARDENILLSPDRSRFAVIDWQYAAFHPPGAPGLLEHLAELYVRKAEAADQDALLERWVPTLPGTGDGASFLARVRALRAARPSMRARLANSKP